MNMREQSVGGLSTMLVNSLSGSLEHPESYGFQEAAVDARPPLWGRRSMN